MEELEDEADILPPEADEVLGGEPEYDCGDSPRVVSVANLAGTALATPRCDSR